MEDIDDGDWGHLKKKPLSDQLKGRKSLTKSNTSTSADYHMREVKVPLYGKITRALKDL